MYGAGSASNQDDGHHDHAQSGFVTGEQERHDIPLDFLFAQPADALHLTQQAFGICGGCVQVRQISTPHDPFHMRLKTHVCRVRHGWGQRLLIFARAPVTAWSKRAQLPSPGTLV